MKGLTHVRYYSLTLCTLLYGLLYVPEALAQESCPDLVRITQELNCARTSVEFVPFFSSLTLPPEVEYQWTFGDGTTSGRIRADDGTRPLSHGTPYYHFYAARPSTEPTLEIFGPGGCHDTATVPFIAEFQEWVCPCPELTDLTVDLDCSSDRRVRFEPTFSGMPTQYRWTFGDETTPVTDRIPADDATNPLISGGSYYHLYAVAASPSGTPTLEIFGPGTCSGSISGGLAEFEEWVCPPCGCPGLTFEPPDPLDCEEREFIFTPVLDFSGLSDSCEDAIDSAIDRYRWRFVDPTISDDPITPETEGTDYLWSESGSIVHRFSRDGRFTVTVRLEGWSSAGSACVSEPRDVEVAVASCEPPRCVGCPTVGFTPVASSSNPCEISFTPSVMDSCFADVAGYSWNFGDGDELVAHPPDPSYPRVTHTYSSDSNPNPLVTVTLEGVNDSDNNLCSSSRNIDVTGCTAVPPTPPAPTPEEDGGFCGCDSDTPLCIFGIDICCILWGLFLISLFAALVFLAFALCGQAWAWWAFGISFGLAIAFAILLFWFCDVNVCHFLLSIAGVGLVDYAFICGTSILPSTCTGGLCSKVRIPIIGIGVDALLVIDLIFALLALLICAIL